MIFFGYVSPVSSKLKINDTNVNKTDIPLNLVVDLEILQINIFISGKRLKNINVAHIFYPTC